MYENGKAELQREFHRGEMYYIQAQDDMFSNRMGRPAVIISSEEECESFGNSLCVVFCTTATRSERYPTNVLLPSSPRKPSYAVCNQVVTVLKENVGSKLATLTAAEMENVDAMVALSLGLSPKKDSTDFENEIESQKIEIAMWKKLYEKTLDQLVEMKLNTDVRRKTEPKTIQSTDEGVDRMDVNRCNLSDLQEVGFSADIARRITFGRPYDSIEDLKKIPGITPTAYKIAKQVLCCVPVEKPKKEEPPTPKVNVNTASWKEFVDTLGMSATVAYSIVGTRKREGKYTSVKDVLRAGKFKESHLKKYGSMLTV